MADKQSIKTKKSSYLVCVRHGESLWNAKGLWTGWQDISLSEKGRSEAKFAAASLKDITFHIAFTSDLKRAHETLDIIKQELNISELPTVKEPDFKERHYGEHTGKNKWQVQKEVGEEKFRRIRRGWDEPIPGGETLKDVYERVIPAYHRHILPAIKSGKNVLFVAHGNSNRALVKFLESVPDHLISEIELATGEVLIYELDRLGRVLKKEKRAINKNKGRQ